jgi:hypothetical protein
LNRKLGLDRSLQPEPLGGVDGGTEPEVDGATGGLGVEPDVDGATGVGLLAPEVEPPLSSGVQGEGDFP